MLLRRNSGSWIALFLLIGPAVLITIWWLTANRVMVRQAAWALVICPLLPIGFCYLRGMALLQRLKQFRQDYSVEVPGVTGPVREHYESRYDYDSFTAADFDTLWVAQRHVRVAAAAFCILASACMTLALFDELAWR